MDELGCSLKLKNCIRELEESAERRGSINGSNPEIVTAQGKGVDASAVPNIPKLTESHHAISEGRAKWRSHILTELQGISSDLGIPFARHRTATTEQARQNREAVLPSETLPPPAERSDGTETDVTNTKQKVFTRNRPPVTARSMLKNICDIRSANHISNTTKLYGWGLIQVELQIPTPDELTEIFNELNPSNRQCGVDEQILKEKFTDDCIRQMSALLAKNDKTAIRQRLKRGAPVCLRQAIWKLILDPTSNEASGNEKRRAHLEALQQDVLKVELLTDDVLRKDIRECADDEKYFVFDDALEKVLLPLSRDVYCTPYATKAVDAIKGFGRGSPNEVLPAYPPSGIIPADGLARLCAPLCFIFTNLVDVYFVLRAMYCRYWSKLYTISSSPSTMLTLCKLFEKLVHIYNPDVAYHCITAGIRPLEIAFPWMFSAFSGYLEVDQLLHLWDRVIAYDNLLLFPILAAAIFLWRGKSILLCDSYNEIRHLFTDFSKIQVIPLLQYLLFA
eukprot:TRINITY_DN2545_c1_g1_i3.p1 TRINITY_DN2545_c1_g1~~TRINITY_DN2545_c1_g1_i3.p1  ORF type:complete len:507 (+),score=60.67 TRINITY_DN2545_c1_g1_i3:223-1743(+)